MNDRLHFQLITVHLARHVVPLIERQQFDWFYQNLDLFYTLEGVKATKQTEKCVAVLASRGATHHNQ